MKNTLLLLCEGSSIDKETGQWSIFNHIENFSVETQKKENFSVRGKFSLVSFWTKETEDETGKLNIKYEFVAPDGEVLMDSSDLTLDIGKGSMIKHRLKMRQITFKNEGKYHFRALKKKEDDYQQVAKIPVKLTVK